MPRSVAALPGRFVWGVPTVIRGEAIVNAHSVRTPDQLLLDVDHETS